MGAVHDVYLSCLSLEDSLFIFMFPRQSCGHKAAFFLHIAACYLLQTSLGLTSYEFYCLLKFPQRKTSKVFFV